MARKRLSDLLREEAHKPREGEAETPPQATSSKRKRSPSPAEAKTTPDATTPDATTPGSETTAGDTVTGNPAAIAPPDQPSIDELNAKLGQAHQREVELTQRVYALQIDLEQQTNRVQTLQADLEHQNKQIETLQADLEQQNKQVETLQADLGKTNSLKTELEQAKQAAMQLAQENNRLSQEIADLQKPKNPVPPTPAPTPSNAALTKVEAMRRQQTQALAHPIFPTSTPLPGHLSDKDLGWVD